MRRARGGLALLLFVAAAIVAYDDSDFFSWSDLLDTARAHHEQAFVVLVVLATILSWTALRPRR